MARSFDNVGCALLLSERERAVVVEACRDRYKATGTDQDASHERHLLYEILYALGVPPGYENNKLGSYDGGAAAQATAGAFKAFFCHTKDGHLCAGRVGCHDMHENLAIRMHSGVDYDAVLNCRPPVPLFASGAEAAAHGKRDIANPGPAARRKIGQLLLRQHRNTKD
jgi:hypothetical protein